MIRRTAATLVLVFMLSMLVGCAAHVHTIGSGPAGSDVTTQRQWYVLWGLAPINKANTATMAGGATNYEIRTEITVLDFVINLFTSAVTVNSRTVTVKK